MILQRSLHFNPFPKTTKHQRAHWVCSFVDEFIHFPNSQFLLISFAKFTMRCRQLNGVKPEIWIPQRSGQIWYMCKHSSNFYAFLSRANNRWSANYLGTRRLSFVVPHPIEFLESWMSLANIPCYLWSILYSVFRLVRTHGKYPRTDRIFLVKLVNPSQSLPSHHKFK